MPLTDAEKAVARLEHEAAQRWCLVTDSLGGLDDAEFGRLLAASRSIQEGRTVPGHYRAHFRDILAAGLCQVRLLRARRAVVEGEQG